MNVLYMTFFFNMRTLQQAYRLGVNGYLALKNNAPRATSFSSGIINTVNLKRKQKLREKKNFRNKGGKLRNSLERRQSDHATVGVFISLL